MSEPKKPFQSVAVVLLPPPTIGRIRTVKECVYIIDAAGDVWRKAGSGAWEFLG